MKSRLGWSMKPSLGLSVALLGLLAGCHHTPVNQCAMGSICQQAVLMAPRHWQQLAQEAAREMAGQWKQAKNLSWANRVVYLPEGNNESPFIQSVRESLATQLLQEGVAVSKKPDQALQVTMQTMLIPRQVEFHADVYDLQVNLTLSDGNRVLWRSSKLYFVDPDNLALYRAGLNLKVIPVVGRT